MKPFVLIAVALSLFAAYAEKQPISRYQSIIDRQMFGPLPPGFDPTKSPNEVQKSSGKEEKQLTQEQEKLQSSIHFSVINVTPEGATAVGFTDNSDPKAPVHYYLKVGEKRNGWEVKEADPNKASMTIAKGDIEVSLTLGGNSANDGGTSRAGGMPANAIANGQRRSGLFSGGLIGGGSQRARRLLRKQEELAAAAKQQEEQSAREAERQEREEADKAQREADRAEMRRQIQEMQDMMRRQRDERDKREKSDKPTDEGGNGANDEVE